MKKLFRSFLFNLLALYLTSRLINSFSIFGGYQTLIYAAFLFTIINLFVKPIVKIFMLPLNFISLGLLSFLVNALMLYLLALMLPQIKVTGWNFMGFNDYGFIIPSFKFNISSTYILISLILSLIINFLNWLCQK